MSQTISTYATRINPSISNQSRQNATKKQNSRTDNYFPAESSDKNNDNKLKFYDRALQILQQSNVMIHNDLFKFGNQRDIKSISTTEMLGKTTDDLKSYASQGDIVFGRSQANNARALITEIDSTLGLNTKLKTVDSLFYSPVRMLAKLIGYVIATHNLKQAQHKNIVSDADMFITDNNQTIKQHIIQLTEMLNSLQNMKNFINQHLNYNDDMGDVESRSNPQNINLANKNSIELLLENINQLKLKITNLQKYCSQHVITLNQDNTKLNEQIKTLQQQVQDQQDKLNLLKINNQELSSDIEQNIQKIQSMELKQKVLTQDLNELQKQNTVAQSTNQQLLTNINDQQQQLNVANVQHNQLIDGLNNKKLVNNQLVREIAQQKQDVNNMEQGIQDLAKELASVKQNVNNKTEQQQQLQEQLYDLELEIQHKKQLQDKATAQLSKLTGVYNIQSAELDSVGNKYQILLANLDLVNMNRKNLIKEIINKNQQIAFIKIEIDNLNKEYTTIDLNNNDVKAQKTTLEEQLAVLKKDNNSHQLALNRLNEEKTDMDARVLELKNNIEQQEQANRSITNNITALQKSITQAKGHYDKLKQRHISLNQEKQQQELQIEDITKQNFQMQQELNILKQQQTQAIEGFNQTKSSFMQTQLITKSNPIVSSTDAISRIKSIIVTESSSENQIITVEAYVTNYRNLAMLISYVNLSRNIEELRTILTAIDANSLLQDLGTIIINKITILEEQSSSQNIYNNCINEICNAPNSESLQTEFELFRKYNSSIREYSKLHDNFYFQLSKLFFVESLDTCLNNGEYQSKDILSLTKLENELLTNSKNTNIDHKLLTSYQSQQIDHQLKLKYIKQQSLGLEQLSVAIFSWEMEKYDIFLQKYDKFHNYKLFQSFKGKITDKLTSLSKLKASYNDKEIDTQKVIQSMFSDISWLLKIKEFMTTYTHNKPVANNFAFKSQQSDITLSDIYSVCQFLNITSFFVLDNLNNQLLNILFNILSPFIAGKKSSVDYLQKKFDDECKKNTILNNGILEYYQLFITLCVKFHTYKNTDELTLQNPSYLAKNKVKNLFSGNKVGKNYIEGLPSNEIIEDRLYIDGKYGNAFYNDRLYIDGVAFSGVFNFPSLHECKTQDLMGRIYINGALLNCNQFQEFLIQDGEFWIKNNNLEQTMLPQTSEENQMVKVSDKANLQDLITFINFSYKDTLIESVLILKLTDGLLDIFKLKLEVYSIVGNILKLVQNNIPILRVLSILTELFKQYSSTYTVTNYFEAMFKYLNNSTKNLNQDQQTTVTNLTHQLSYFLLETLYSNREIALDIQLETLKDFITRLNYSQRVVILENSKETYVDLNNSCVNKIAFCNEKWFDLNTGLYFTGKTQENILFINGQLADGSHDYDNLNLYYRQGKPFTGQILKTGTSFKYVEYYIDGNKLAESEKESQYQEDACGQLHHYYFIKNLIEKSGAKKKIHFGVVSSRGTSIPPPNGPFTGVYDGKSYVNGYIDKDNTLRSQNIIKQITAMEGAMEQYQNFFSKYPYNKIDINKVTAISHLEKIYNNLITWFEAVYINYTSEHKTSCEQNIQVLNRLLQQNLSLKAPQMMNLETIKNNDPTLYMRYLEYYIREVETVNQTVNLEACKFITNQLSVQQGLNWEIFNLSILNLDYLTTATKNKLNQLLFKTICENKSEAQIVITNYKTFSPINNFFKFCISRANELSQRNFIDYFAAFLNTALSNTIKYKISQIVSVDNVRIMLEALDCDLGNIGYLHDEIRTELPTKKLDESYLKEQKSAMVTHLQSKLENLVNRIDTEYNKLQNTRSQVSLESLYVTKYGATIRFISLMIIYNSDEKAIMSYKGKSYEQTLECIDQILNVDCVQIRKLFYTDPIYEDYLTKDERLINVAQSVNMKRILGLSVDQNFINEKNLIRMYLLDIQGLLKEQVSVKVTLNANGLPNCKDTDFSNYITNLVRFAANYSKTEKCFNSVKTLSNRFKAYNKLVEESAEEIYDRCSHDLATNFKDITLFNKLTATNLTPHIITDFDNTLGSIGVTLDKVFIKQNNVLRSNKVIAYIVHVINKPNVDLREEIKRIIPQDVDSVTDVQVTVFELLQFILAYTQISSKNKSKGGIGSDGAADMDYVSRAMNLLNQMLENITNPILTLLLKNIDFRDFFNKLTGFGRNLQDKQKTRCIEIATRENIRTELFAGTLTCTDVASDSLKSFLGTDLDLRNQGILSNTKVILKKPEVLIDEEAKQVRKNALNKAKEELQKAIQKIIADLDSAVEGSVANSNNIRWFVRHKSPRIR